MRAVDVIPLAQRVAEILDSQPFDWPEFGLEADIRPALAEAIEAGEPVVLATLHTVQGGAPFGVGAQMLLSPRRLSGFLSGGCIEGDVWRHAAGVLSDGEPRRLVYGEGGPFDIRLPCGSRIEILLERVAPDDAAAKRLVAQSAKRRPLLWVTNGVSRACVEPGNLGNLPPPLGALRLSEAPAGCWISEEPFLLCRSYAPRTRLVVVGSDPVALALIRLASEMGHETVLVRPRGPDGPPASVSRYLRMAVSEAFEAVKPDPWTAIAVVTHDVDQEHEALCAVLRTPAFYVGALGSRRRVPERNARLLNAGFSAEEIAGVRAPIGLPTGAKAPWEIAVSVMAEIVAVSRSEESVCAGGAARMDKA